MIRGGFLRHPRSASIRADGARSAKPVKSLEIKGFCVVCRGEWWGVF